MKNSSVLAGQEIVQQTGMRWNGEHNAQYHIYVILWWCDLTDGVALAYSASLRRKERMLRSFLDVYSKTLFTAHQTEQKVDLKETQSIVER